MGIFYKKFIDAHKNIYSENIQDRKVGIEYCVPETGVNSNTGILVLVPGYGGRIDSKVYTHIRRDVFADLYNLIIIQCDYFGIEYMSVDLKKQVSDFVHSNETLEEYYKWNIRMNETKECFNDMGIMQALDIIQSTLFVIKQYDYQLDFNRIIIFGTSHGGYLAHLCNILCSGLYSHILDVSGYIRPYYLERSRYADYVEEFTTIHCVYDHLITMDDKLKYDEVLYDLSFLYNFVDNSCCILSFQGNQDWMVDYKEKEVFIQKIKNAQFLLYTEEDLDDKVFKSCNHGLDLDFIAFLNAFLNVIERNAVSAHRDLRLNDLDIPDKLRVTYMDNFPCVEYIKWKE